MEGPFSAGGPMGSDVADRPSARRGPRVLLTGALTAAQLRRPAPDREDRKPFRLGHRPELDGLRGIAVLLVVVYHMSLLLPDASRWLLRGGFLGVDLFLALSGFLITALLLAERNRTGTIDLVAFLARRARRLIPALGAILTVALVVAATDTWYTRAGIYRVDEVLGTAAWSLSFAANWAVVLGHSLQPLGHVWTLGLEGQFYLVWGLAFLAATRARRPLRLVSHLAVVGAVAVLTWRWYSHTTDPADLWVHYVSTFTRLDGPLIGALAAVWVVGGRPARFGAAVWQTAGWTALAALGLAACVVRPFEPELFRWGYTAVAGLAATAVLGAVLAAETPYGRLLRVRPLRAAGRISYSLYLWHLPVFLLLWERASHWPRPAAVAVGVVVSLALASVSHRWVERPFLRRSAGVRPAPVPVS